MKVAAIVQARMGSKRLPGKVLLEIGGRPMLAWVVERLRRAKTLDAVIVATSTASEDDLLDKFCRKQGYPIERGSLLDVLDRIYQAARRQAAEAIVRITADCPFSDPGLIDQAVRLFHSDENAGFTPATGASAEELDFLTNRLPPPWGRTTPIGLDIEICTFAVLERAWREAKEPHQREHVMPYLYEDLPEDALRHGELLRQASDDVPRALSAGQSQGNNSSDRKADRAKIPLMGTWRMARAVSPQGLRLAQLHHDPDYGRSRWTVDTGEDLTLAREIVSRFPDDRFGWLDLVELMMKEPHLAQINAGVIHKTARDSDLPLAP